MLALIGPSGCGKSTFLRCINRMNDIIPGGRVEGEIILDGESIYENIAYGLRINGIKNRYDIDRIVEKSLKNTALWDEVKDRLHESAFGLSGGQQQRLCIARTVAIEPEVILMDEPASALDPLATQKIEELIQDLKEKYTIIIVTHNMQQAARVSDYTAFFYLGELVELAPTDVIFTKPAREMTENYITGKFG